MTPTQNQFNLLMSHQDQVIELPNQAEILASNDLCPFYMIQKDNNLTIQGHPEFNKTFAQTVLEEDRKAILDPVLYKKALESLSIQQDDQLVAQWIINFLNITL
jgi:GMP synthase-like glutamine amidotransferase